MLHKMMALDNVGANTRWVFLNIIHRFSVIVVGRVQIGSVYGSMLK